MNTVSELYEKLSENYYTKWIEDGIAFELRYAGKNKQQYRIFVSEDYVDISEKRKFLNQFYWKSIKHAHFDSENDTLADVYDCVIFYMKQFRSIEKT